MVLIVVIICLALAGSLLVMISHSLTQQATTVRHERAELTLRQIIDSGRAWAGLHPEALTDTAGVSLDASSLAPADAVATVLLTLEPVYDDTNMLVITAHLQVNTRHFERTSRFPMPAS